MQILLLPLQSFRVGITKKALQWEVPLLFSAELHFLFIFGVIHHAGDRVRPSFISRLTHDIINSATSLMRANLICANRSRLFDGEGARERAGRRRERMRRRERVGEKGTSGKKREKKSEWDQERRKE